MEDYFWITVPKKLKGMCLQIKPEIFYKRHNSKVKTIPEINSTFKNLTKAKYAKFRLRFNVYDRDANGIITVNELLTILREMGQNVTKADLDDMMRAVDLGSKTDIHFDEFLMMVANKEASEEHVQELKDAFKVFDNGKGYISERDLRTIMLNMGERLTEEEVDEMIQEATIKDGNIKISDFITVLCR